MTKEQREAKTNCVLDIERTIESWSENYDIDKRLLMEEVVAYLNRKIAQMLKAECSEEEEEEEDSFIFPEEWTIGEIKQE